MTEFNQKTTMDYLARYDPHLMDSEYMDKENMLYKKSYTKMPNEIDFTFDRAFSGVKIDGHMLEDI